MENIHEESRPAKRQRLTEIPFLERDLDPFSYMRSRKNTEYVDFKQFENHIRTGNDRPLVGTARRRSTDDKVVLKKYSVLHSKLAYPINEVICLMKLRHLPCVIKLLDYYIDKQTLEFVLVLEYPYPCYTVYDYLKENLPGEVTCKYILSRIANALLVCSASGYACGDVNLENALVCVTGDHVATIKLIDFETCTDLANGNYSLTGCVYTPAYRSPEQNQYPCDYDKEKAQVYAMGCMIQEMMNMKLIPLYSRVRLLVASMKTKNPELRLSLARFVSHAFFNV